MDPKGIASLVNAISVYERSFIGILWFQITEKTCSVKLKGMMAKVLKVEKYQSHKKVRLWVNGLNGT